MTAAVMTPSRRYGAGANGRPSGRHLELYRPGPFTAAGPSARPGRRSAPRRQTSLISGAVSPGRSRPGAARPVAGGRRHDPAVYRRRRVLAAGLLLLAIAAVLILAQLIGAGIGGGPLTTTGAAAGPGMIPAGTTEYVVRPGDSLWSIAARLAPGSDERPLVDRLAAETHGASLYPGEVIAIPAR